MAQILIQTNALTKLYHQVPVIQDMTLTIEKGHIYGLIGKNGAGKTTFIRMLAGLTMPSSGEMSFYGQKEAKALNKCRSKMSFMVETPFMESHMTAYENLNLQRLQRGISNKTCIHEVLTLVGLSKVGKKKVGAFSLGMRQRLGLAIAMLSKPEFLVLDEPLNGLDPEGIVEMRKLLKRLKEEYGVTILIASHLLSELYEVATDYVIVHEGRILETLSAKELNSKCEGYIDVGVNQVEAAIKCLKAQQLIEKYQVIEPGHIYIYNKVAYIGDISRVLVKAGIDVLHLSYYKQSLEEYFISRIERASIEGGEKNA